MRPLWVPCPGEKSRGPKAASGGDSHFLRTTGKRRGAMKGDPLLWAKQYLVESLRGAVRMVGGRRGAVGCGDVRRHIGPRAIEIGPVSHPISEVARCAPSDDDVGCACARERENDRPPNRIHMACVTERIGIGSSLAHGNERQVHYRSVPRNLPWITAIQSRVVAVKAVRRP